jgi:D-cysteine desulfhydrase
LGLGEEFSARWREKVSLAQLPRRRYTEGQTPLKFLPRLTKALGGPNILITCGSVQSNHCRLILAAACKEGLPCHFAIEERVPGSYKEQASGNNFLFHLMRIASVTVMPGGFPALYHYKDYFAGQA